MDGETRSLDKEIFSLLRRHASTQNPEAFELLALKIFKYQFLRNRHYQKYSLLDGKTPENVKSWKDIPAMPAQGFKELSLATFPTTATKRVFQTSGTSLGKKGRHFFDTLKLYETAILHPFKRYLLPDNENLKFFFLMEPPRKNPTSSLSHMMGVVNRELAGSGGKYYVEAGRVQNENLLEDLKKTKHKVFILATAFSLKQFLDFLKNKKIALRLPPKSRLMETGGFKGKTKSVSKNELYRMCEKWLGLSAHFCVSEYGMTELSSQFYDTTLRNHVLKIHKKAYKIGPPWLRTLVMDPSTGQEAAKGRRGLLRHFDLANRGSVLAVQTEDIGRAVGNEGGFELLGRAPESLLRGCSLDYE